MSVPVPHRSSFTHSTLQLIEKNADAFRLSDALFFRGAWTANVAEKERRTYQPVVLIDGVRIRIARCGCSPTMRGDDLCRHIAILLERMHDGAGRLISEDFGASVWWKVGLSAFAEGVAAPAVEGENDAREQMLRRMVLSPAEQQLLARGAGSQKLLFELSDWYRWSKQMFLHGHGAEVKLTIRDGAARLAAGSGEGVALPPAAVEHLVTSAPELVAASGYEIRPDGVTPSLRIEIARGRELRLAPVLLSATGLVHERAAVPRFGRWFLVGDRFASPAHTSPMFADRSERDQGLLFEVRPSAGVPLDRETTIDEEEVFAFIEKHQDELARMPEALAPVEVRNARPVRLDGEVVFDFSSQHRDLLEVDVRFAIPGTDDEITAASIAKARRDGVRALIREHVWIDIADAQFDWIEETKFGSNGRMLVTKLELMRIRGSLRGQAVFRGNDECAPVFALFDEVRAASSGSAPDPVAMNLYAYQQTGYQWLWLLQQNGFGGLLCDDMGLGKTHQAIALIRGVTHVDPSRTVLVVCPTSVVDHWRERLDRYAPGAAVTLTTYGLVRSRIEQFRGKRFDLMVLDEAQTVKNADTATHQALRAIEKRIAVGLTGTPIENHEGELKTLLDFVVPGYLPKHVPERSTLRRLVRPFVLRRTKDQVLTELPPKIVDKRFCELTPEQKALYGRVLEARVKPLRNQLRAGARISYVHVFAALNYLKQICNHPASAGGGFGEDVTSAKWEMFVELLDECMASGLKVVVFSQYLQMLSIIEEHLFRSGIGYASIKGATRARGEEIARFRDDDSCRVFTASLRAGGLGIDLTSASVVIHYDRWWNQAREDQATDRVHRLGQNKGVQVIKLITRGTIEEKIDALITAKGSIATDVVRVDDPALVKQFTREELEELLS